MDKLLLLLDFWNGDKVRVLSIYKLGKIRRFHGHNVFIFPYVIGYCLVPWPVKISRLKVAFSESLLANTISTSNQKHSTLKFKLPTHDLSSASAHPRTMAEEWNDFPQEQRN